MKNRTFLPGLLWVLVIFASVSFGQTSTPSPLTVKVPFEFVVGNQTFPAGVYKFRSLLRSSPDRASIDVLEVRGTEGQHYSAIVTDVIAAPEAIHPKLVFTHIGGRAFLSELWEAGRQAGCRLQNHIQSAEKEAERITLLASADWR
ncbi:MAG: hypothetical protein ACLQLC_09375 [Candidatus Sulfotelmatobacter sp.]